MSTGARKLGRGLQSLLGLEEDHAPAVPTAPPGPALFSPHQPPSNGDGVSTSTAATGEFLRLAISQIDTNPYQPRREFAADELQGLVDSIRTHGVIQAICVRQAGERYQLIAGERRLRAAEAAGLTELPARILEVTDQQLFELALIENLQRVDLNAIEKATAFQNYIQQFNVTHERLAGQLGIDRSTVTNLLRLLELPETVRRAVESGEISAGHARALLSVDDTVQQIELCRQIIREALSVRQVERMVKELRTTPAAAARPPKPEINRSTHVVHLENTLRQSLGTKVEIQQKAKDRGTIVIHFGSNDDFDRVVRMLQRS